MSSTQVTLGGREVTLRPLTTGEFLELIYMASDVLHEGLRAWASKPDSYSFVTVLLNHIDKEDALRLIPMFLHVDRQWLEENTTPDEVYEAFKQAVSLNDWQGIFQAMVTMDTIGLEEIMAVWQTVKAS